MLWKQRTVHVLWVYNAIFFKIWASGHSSQAESKNVEVRYSEQSRQKRIMLLLSMFVS